MARAAQDDRRRTRGVALVAQARVGSPVTASCPTRTLFWWIAKIHAAHKAASSSLAAVSSRRR